jgi:exonuclease III
MEIKILTWNLNKAAYRRKNLWGYLRELEFSIGLFQEVYVIPHEIRKNYHVVRGEMNAILLKKDNIFANVEKENILPVNSENDAITDFCVSCETKLSENKLVLISVYNYIPGKITYSRDFLEILYKYIDRGSGDKIIIVGGDFNMDEKFRGKSTKEWGPLAKNVKEELSQLGYREVLSEKMGRNAFTYSGPRNKEKYQLDYLFIPEDINLVDVRVEDKNEIFKKPRLSDHLPIIATVEI